MIASRVCQWARHVYVIVSPGEKDPTCVHRTSLERLIIGIKLARVNDFAHNYCNYFIIAIYRSGKTSTCKFSD